MYEWLGYWKDANIELIRREINEFNWKEGLFKHQR